MTRACLCLLAFLLFSGCVINDAHPPNDCLIVAVRARAELPASTWSRLLLVQYPSRAMGHAYLVYSLPGDRVACYDRTFGSRIIRPRSRSAVDVAAAADPLATGGSYVEDLER